MVLRFCVTCKVIRKTAGIPFIALIRKKPLADQKKNSTGFEGLIWKPIDIKEFYTALNSILSS